MESVSTQNLPFHHQEVDSASITEVQHLYSYCLGSFTQLSSLLKTPSTSEVQPLGERLFSTLLDEMGRFRVWAASTGANQQAGKNSLDYRLQEAPHIHQRVIVLLRELEKDILEVIRILKHGQQKPEWSISLEENPSTGSAQEDNDPGASELESVLTDIGDIISNLYQLSTMIRNPAAQARVKELASIDVSQYKDEDFKNARLYEMAPLFLVERLARANTKRRQLLIYYKRRALRMMPNISLPGSRSFKTKGTPSEVSTQKYERAVFTGWLRNAPARPLEVDPSSIFAPSGSGQNKSNVPEFGFGTQELECPVCGVRLNRYHIWKQHVTNHLKPYICTNEACPTPDRLFDSKDDWYEHEIQCHWREWFCECCLMVVSDRDKFRDHIIRLHSKTCLPRVAIGPGEIQKILDSVIDRCERQSTSKIRCPICINLEYNVDEIKNHLSRHFQDLVALILSSIGDTVVKEPNKTFSKPQDISEGRFVANVNQDASELMSTNKSERPFSEHTSSIPINRYSLAPIFRYSQLGLWDNLSSPLYSPQGDSVAYSAEISIRDSNKDESPRRSFKKTQNERSTTHSPQLQPHSELQKDQHQQDSSTHDPMPPIERHDSQSMPSKTRKLSPMAIANLIAPESRTEQDYEEQGSGLAPRTLDEKSGSSRKKSPAETEQGDSLPPPSPHPEESI